MTQQQRVGRPAETHGELIERVKPHMNDTFLPLIEEMGVSSLFNLISALEAAQIEGVGGKLTLRIPAKAGRIEADWQPTRNVRRHD